MAASFKAAGWKIVPFGQACDVCVINTCTVTSKAERDCLRLSRSVKRSNKNTKVILAGCAAEVNGERLIKEGWADITAGQDVKFRLPELLQTHNFKTETKVFRRHDTTPVFDSTRALIKVQDGCDFCCSYCIVPSARGQPTSRAFHEIINEAKALADHGYKEIVLTGANLGCYRDHSRQITDLLDKVENIPGISRIRLSSIELSTVEHEIIDYMTNSDKLCRSIHIPMQSGDNNILRLMGRRYTVEQYIELIEYAVSRIPLLGLGTDILVGFPGETEEAFDNTLQLVNRLPFSNLHIFSYSKRPGTKAAEITGQVDEKTKKCRSRTLIDLGKRKKQLFAQKFIGREVSVLIENVQRNTGSGWTGEYIQAEIPVSKGNYNQIIPFIPHLFSGYVLK